MKVSISVVICTKNRFNDFKETVKSLARQHRQPDELIVVDSSDNVHIREYMESIDIPSEYHYIHTAPGLTYQRNIGIKNCSGDLIYFFDDDVELDSNYIGLVEKVFGEDSSHLIGAVGGRISNVEYFRRMTFAMWLKRKFFNAIKYVFLLSNIGNGMFRYSGMPSFPHLLKRSRYIECLSGCCMAFRREVFIRASFDEHLPGYGQMEDVDISKQVLDLGYKTYYEASAVLDHKVSPQNRLKTRELAEMMVLNYDYLFQKHWTKSWGRKLAYNWTLLGLLLLGAHDPLSRQGVLSGLKQIVRKNTIFT